MALLSIGVLAFMQLVMQAPFLASLLGLVALFGLYGERSDRLVGAEIIWREGEWFIVRQKQETRVSLAPGTVNVPALVYFRLNAVTAPGGWNILLFSDSAQPDQLRQLRCRLTLSLHTLDLSQA